MKLEILKKETQWQVQAKLINPEEVTIYPL